MFRTVPAQWFEELIAKPMLARAVEVLAETGEVEFEFTETDDPALELSELRVTLEPYHQIVRSYQDYLVPPIAPDAVATERLEVAIERNLNQLQAWQASVAPFVSELEKLLQEHWQLAEIADFLSLVDHSELDLSALHDASPALEMHLFVLPKDTETPEIAERILHLRVDNDRAVYLMTLGTSLASDEAERAMSGVDGRNVAIPEWLTGSISTALTAISDKNAEVAQSINNRRLRLSEISAEHKIGVVLGELRRLDWLVEHLEGAPVGEYFARLTGWTSDPDGHQLRAALEAASLPTVLYMTQNPAKKTPPSLIRNPLWIRPFEFFANLMGTPGHTEADPSPLIAIVAPFLFGYMFGDVGHGLVILLIGLLLRKRWPPVAMLISCGIMSIVFGFLYGSFFTFEQVIPALWVNPFEAPLVILFVPLLCGAVLILLGMALNGLGHFWEGRFGYWLRSEAGIMLAYVALLVSVVDIRYLPGLLFGVIWHLLGKIWSERENGLAAVGSSLGDLFEYTLQLLVNTISFVRVGAFALAHAGLGATVFSLADSSEHWQSAALILLIGNVAIIGLEGLVVSVQTTRLLLFEFFIRFMKAGGRPFRPMVPPDYSTINSTIDATIDATTNTRINTTSSTTINGPGKEDL